MPRHAWRLLAPYSLGDAYREDRDKGHAFGQELRPAWRVGPGQAASLRLSKPIALWRRTFDSYYRHRSAYNRSPCIKA